MSLNRQVTDLEGRRPCLKSAATLPRSAVLLPGLAVILACVAVPYAPVAAHEAQAAAIVPEVAVPHAPMAAHEARATASVPEVAAILREAAAIVQESVEILTGMAAIPARSAVNQSRMAANEAPSEAVVSRLAVRWRFLAAREGRPAYPLTERDGDPEVLEVPAELRHEDSVLLAYGVMAVPSTPVLDSRDGATKAITGCPPLHDPLALARLAREVREA